MKMLLRNKLAVLFVVAALLIAVAAAGATATPNHAMSTLAPVGGSGVHGTVHLVQLPQGGTQIFVLARGLMPGKRYVSLYYDNDHCALEPYSAEDVIGGTYTANPSGIGFTSGVADDDLDEIHSVSVRKAGSFQLQACAPV
jgi:hypothetical protein